jgi:hypothetical protein
MFSKPRQLISGAAAAASTTIRGLTGQSARSKAAEKAARTRRQDTEQRSEAARRAAETRRARAQERSASAKQGARTRAQRDARVDAMVEATKRD